MTPQGIPPLQQNPPERISFPHQCGHVLPWPKGRYCASSIRARQESHCEWEGTGRETMPIVSAPLRLTPKFAFLFRAVSCLPAGLLSLGPLGRGGSGRGSTRLPGGGLGLGPVARGGSREGSRGSSSLPVTATSSEAGLDGGNTLLINTGELLLLDLLLSLGLRVAV